MIYDPASDSWSISGSAPVSHAATAGSTTGVKAPKRIYFFDENRTDVYDPSSGTWTTGTAAPTTRLIAKAAVYEDLFYLIGGRTGQWGYMTFMYSSALNEQYTPFGYGKPSSSPSIEPTPLHSATPASSPTPTPSESPTTSPEDMPSNNKHSALFTSRVVIASGALIAAIAFCLLIYFKKRKKSQGKNHG